MLIVFQHQVDVGVVEHKFQLFLELDKIFAADQHMSHAFILADLIAFPADLVLEGELLHGARQRVDDHFVLLKNEHPHIPAMHLADPLVAGDLLLYAHGEDRSPAVFAFHRQVAAHHHGQVLADGEAKAGAVNGPVLPGIHLGEGFEELAKVLFFDANAAVPHLKCHLVVDVIQEMPLCPQLNEPLMRELDGVADQVHQYLLDADVVPHRVAGQRRVDVHHEEHRPPRQADGDDIAHVHKKGRQHIFDFRDLKFSRLDLGKVQDVVDDGQKAAAGVLDGVDVHQDIRRQGLAEQDLTDADDGVHGRADLVAHIGQEGALGMVGLLGLFRGLPELLLDGLLLVDAGGQHNDVAIILFKEDAFHLLPRLKAPVVRHQAPDRVGPLFFEDGHQVLKEQTAHELPVLLPDAMPPDQVVDAGIVVLLAFVMEAHVYALGRFQERAHMVLLNVYEVCLLIMVSDSKLADLLHDGRLGPGLVELVGVFHDPQHNGGLAGGILFDDLQCYARPVVVDVHQLAAGPVDALEAAGIHFVMDGVEVAAHKPVPEGVRHVVEPSGSPMELLDPLGGYAIALRHEEGEFHDPGIFKSLVDHQLPLGLFPLFLETLLFQNVDVPDRKGIRRGRARPVAGKDAELAALPDGGGAADLEVLHLVDVLAFENGFPPLRRQERSQERTLVGVDVFVYIGFKAFHGIRQAFLTPEGVADSPALRDAAGINGLIHLHDRSIHGRFPSLFLFSFLFSGGAF